MIGNIRSDDLVPASNQATNRRLSFPTAIAQKVGKCRTH